MRDIGGRVGAILGAKGRAVRLIGYGTYEGYKPIDDLAVGPFADMLRSFRVPSDAIEPTGATFNPRIRLDDGSHVWGCECWWAAEEAVQELVRQWAERGRIIVRVDINEVRRQYAASSEETD
jgi:hypothetical protein